MEIGFHILKTAGLSRPVQPLESKRVEDLTEEEIELLEQKYC